MRQKNSSEISEIAALIARLMNHYWTAAEPAALRQAQAEDWLDDLTEFSPAIVEEACRTYRRSQPDRRPGPGHIRKLCVELRRDQHEHIALSAPGGERPLTYHERRAALQAIRDANREADNANYERLRRLRDEMNGLRGSGSMRHVGSALGVTAREYTKEELRAGRIALGLEKEAAE